MRSRYAIVVIAALATIVFVSGAQAQLNSTAAALSINANYAGSLAVSVSPTTVNMTLQHEQVTSAEFHITLTANTDPSATVALYAYAGTYPVLSTGSAWIYAEDVFVTNEVDIPLALLYPTPFSEYGVTILERAGGSYTIPDIFGRILVDTRGVALELGTYTGTIYIQAQAL